MYLQSFLECKALWNTLYQIEKTAFLRKEATKVKGETLFANFFKEKIVEVFQKRVLCELNICFNFFKRNFSDQPIVTKHVVSPW